MLGGGEVTFLLGRHALKTYVRVQESSRSAMRVRAWAETLSYRSWLHGVTGGMMSAHREIAHGGQHAGHGWSRRRCARARRDHWHRRLSIARSERARSGRYAEARRARLRGRAKSNTAEHVQVAEECDEHLSRPLQLSRVADMGAGVDERRAKWVHMRRPRLRGSGS